MKYLLALLLVVTSLASAATRPNVVLILADDLGYETLGCNGGQSYKTPNLDQLAATGVRFSHCYAQPLCTPTRVMLMTGKSNARNYTHFGHLDLTQKTFGNFFKDAGYATCITGKWQLKGEYEGPAHFGFDEYCLWQLTRRPNRYKDPGLEVNGKEMDYKSGEYGPDIVSEYALDFVTRKKDVPFFLYYPMMLVHAPYDPTPDSTDYAETGSTKGKGKDGNGHFGDMVPYMDKLVGKLVARLEELHLRDNTLILFLGDNGTGRGTKSMFEGREVIGAKGTTIRWGNHVPGIGNWPGHVVSGKVCDDLIDASDFLPTICEAANVTVPADNKLDGRSFFPQLRGDKGTPRDWVYSWYNPSGGVTAKAEFAHDANYKLYLDGRFYDKLKDELEQSPLSAEGLNDAAKVSKAKLQAAIQQYAGARQPEFIKQAQAFGGEGEDINGKKSKKGKKGKAK